MNSIVKFISDLLSNLDGDQFPEEAAKEIYKVFVSKGVLVPVWTEVREFMPDQATTVLGYSLDWVDEDFNPAGIRECHYCGLSVDDAEWISAKWCDSQDFWDADTDTAPTHWCAVPVNPYANKVIAFDDCLREEFLINTQNYPESYHALFQEKYNRAKKRFETGS